MLRPQINRRYDNIWLSNIYAYLDDNDLIKAMFYHMLPLLNEGGKLLLGYIYGPYNTSSYYDDSDLNKMTNMLSGMNLEAIKFMGTGGQLKLIDKPHDDCVLVFERNRI